MSVAIGQLASEELVLNGTEDEVHVSPAETVNLDDVELRAEYSFEEYGHFGIQSGRVVAKLFVQLDDINRMPKRSGWGLVDELGLKAVAIKEWVVVRDDVELFTADGSWQLDISYQNWKREQTKDAYGAQLDAFVLESVRLARLGRPTDTLDHLIREAGSRIRYFNQFWKKGADSAGVTTLLRSIENEINRIADGGPELLVDDLLDGKIYHPDVTRNQKVIDEVKSRSIRTGGFIEMLTPDTLRQFYLQRIGSVEHVDRLGALDLRLRLDDYAPDDVLHDPEVGCAPGTIMIEGRKNEAAYPVIYDLYEIDGEPVPVAVVSIPLATYQRNAAEYGKKSGFPELPHGIRLFFELTVDGKVIAKGFDDETMAKRLTKYGRSKSRGRAIEGVGGDALSIRRWSPISAGELPPWYKGSRVRW